MKTKKLISYAIFMFLPLVITLIALPFMREEIPAHYGYSLVVDRWGSKYESLVLPILTVGFGLLMFVIAKLAGKVEEENDNNERVTLTCGLVFLVLFNVIDYYLLYVYLNRVINLSKMPIDLMSFLTILFGMVFIFIGNIVPKTRKNSLIGFRTPWTMKNEVTWKKCQLFGGITMMIAGALLIVGGTLIFKGNTAIIFLLSVIFVMVIADVVYSYFIMRKYGDCSSELSDK